MPGTPHPTHGLLPTSTTATDGTFNSPATTNSSLPSNSNSPISPPPSPPNGDASNHSKEDYPPSNVNSNASPAPLETSIPPFPNNTTPTPPASTSTQSHSSHPATVTAPSTVSSSASSSSSQHNKHNPSSSNSQKDSAVQPAGASSPPPVAAGLKGMAAAAKKMQQGPELSEEEKEALAGYEGGHPLSKEKLEERGYHSFMCLGRPFHVEKRWKLVRELGQGAYGLVVSAQDDISGETIAIKMITRVFDKAILARRALREITLLRHFAAHENITGLIDLDIVHPGYNEIYMFMEPMEADLHQIIRSGQQLSNSHVQYFMYQLLRGMKYIHSANVLHRDIKPGNVLVNADCELKICDFGLARGFRAEEDGRDSGPLTEYVATRWYRAPEILLSYRKYTQAIDVWSIGCILAELLGGKPIFKGKDYVDQLNLILNVLGTPDDDTLSKVASEKASKYVKSLPHMPTVDLATLYPEAEENALDLLAKLLSFDPTTRIPVTEALEHPYLAAYHDPADEPSCPSLFDKWEEVEGLEKIEDFRKAIEREVNEFRAEVRAVDEWEGEEEDGEGREGGSSEETGEHMEGAEARMVISGEVGGDGWRESPRDVLAAAASKEGELLIDGLPPSSSHLDPNSLDPLSSLHAGLPSSSTSQHIKSSSDQTASSTTSRPSLHFTPSHSRTQSEVNGEPPLSAASSATSSHHSRPRGPPRRPSSGFFDPFNRRPQSLSFTPSSSAVNTPSTSANPSPGQHTSNQASASHTHHAHTHSEILPSQMSRPSRSRQHSHSSSYGGEGSLRPLLRSLSTVSITDSFGKGHLVGGFSKLSPAPPISAAACTAAPALTATSDGVLETGGAGGAGAEGKEGGLSVVPPMMVSPSDAPPSEMPHEFGLGGEGSRDISGGRGSEAEEDVLGFSVGGKKREGEGEGENKAS